MKYIRIKKQILEFKLELVNIQLEKKEFIQNQRIESLPNLEEKEREILQELIKLKDMLIEQQLNFQNITEQLDDFYNHITLINEIKCACLPFNQFDEKLEDFGTRLLIEYDKLLSRKYELIRQDKHEEANQIQQQIMGIGDFMLKYAKA